MNTVRICHSCKKALPPDAPEGLCPECLAKVALGSGVNPPFTPSEAPTTPAHTAGFAWYQKIGGTLVLKPSVRYHQQDAADFYGVMFTSTPEFYSADYRLSNAASLSYGLKAVWTPREGFSVDVAFDRYQTWGRDGITSGDAYPDANIITAGFRFGF